MAEQRDADMARLSEMMVQAIDEYSDADLADILRENDMDPAELSKLSRDWTRKAIIAHGKARFSQAKDSVAQRALIARQSVSLDYDSMLAIVRNHIANDPQSPLTLAARNQSGALSPEELQSLVEDIYSLKG
ncbi:MAG: hypothetical protein EBR82_21235 [Caulobacteraceae bacterium]|nr:hypothetical protein [Caulobacteraceae bacterium]